MIVVKNFHNSEFLKQVYVIYESMLKRVSNNVENQVTGSLLCVAFPRLPQSGEGALQNRRSTSRIQQSDLASGALPW